MRGATCSGEVARALDGRCGARQDWQRSYEDSATARLVHHGPFGRAQAVVGFRHGTDCLVESVVIAEKAGEG